MDCCNSRRLNGDGAPFRKAVTKEWYDEWCQPILRLIEIYKSMKIVYRKYSKKEKGWITVEKPVLTFAGNAGFIGTVISGMATMKIVKSLLWDHELLFVPTFYLLNYTLEGQFSELRLGCGGARSLTYDHVLPGLRSSLVRRILRIKGSHVRAASHENEMSVWDVLESAPSVKNDELTQEEVDAIVGRAADSDVEAIIDKFEVDPQASDEDRASELIRESTLSYIAGFVGFRIIGDGTDCNSCDRSLVGNGDDVITTLSDAKNFDDHDLLLKYPTKKLYELVSISFRILDSNMKQFIHLPKPAATAKPLLLSMIKKVPELDLVFCSTHNDCLLETIVDSLCRIFIKWFTKRSFASKRATVKARKVSQFKGM